MKWKMPSDKASMVTGAIGLGMVLVGGLMYWRGSKPGMAGLGRLSRVSYPQAPIVGGYSDGNMKTVLRASKDMPIEQRIATIQDLIHRSIQDGYMRKVALQATAMCPERDQKCEAEAIYQYVKARVRYTGDVSSVMHPDGSYEGIDLYQSARRTLEMSGGDCLPAGTLLLTDRHEFVPIERLLIGSRIWGKDSWTDVKDVWFKGVLPVDVVHMNNGSSFTATEDHKVYVAICSKHPIRWDSGKSCTCPINERSIERLKVAQLEPGMVLVQPKQIAFGDEHQDPRRAYVEGLYISDGWQGHEQSFNISGRDGHPKEAQKREVQEICAALGVATTWGRKDINVRDKEWTQRISLMGKRAPFKQAISIGLREDAARELLRGIMADSGANTNGGGRTFTTTSRTLMLQTRMLLRMCGLSCSERYIVDHGGEGENPIWRLGVRDADATYNEKLLRVREIDRAVTSKPVYDIATADHYVYLPEADVTVSNCDDQAILNSTMLALNGIEARLRVVRQRKDPDWSHIYSIALINGKEIALDTTLPGNRSFGYETPIAKQIDFPA